MDKDTALRLALKAMKVSNSAWKSLADSGDAGFWKAEKQGYYQLNEQAITAVEAALEEKDEPDWKDMYEKQKRHSEMWIAKYEKDIGPLEKAVPHQEAKDEPVQVSECQVSHNHIWIEDLYKHQEKNT